MSNLTFKQEAFCKAIVSGKNQSDAYREAYPASLSYKPETLQNNAYKLMQNNEIITRIGELRIPIQEEFTKSKVDILNKLQDLIEKAEDEKTEITDSVSIQQVRECLKEQAKLLGFYEDTLKVKGDKENPLQTNITVEFTKSHQHTQERINDILTEEEKK